MGLFNAGNGYYLLQAKGHTCFLGYVEKDGEGSSQITSAIAINSPVGIQMVRYSDITNAVCLNDLGMQEIPCDFRSLLSTLWTSSENGFWDYNLLLVNYFHDALTSNCGEFMETA